MEQREKLIELITNFYDGDSVCDTCANDKSYGRCNKCISTHETDYLLANGVVVLPCRCCECEHCEIWQDDVEQWCTCTLRCGYDVVVDPTDFCSFGKRKGGDE